MNTKLKLNSIKSVVIAILIGISMSAAISVAEALSLTIRASICVGDCPTSGLGCWPVLGTISQGPGQTPTHAGTTAFDIAGWHNGVHIRYQPVFTPVDGWLSALSTNCAEMTAVGAPGSAGCAAILRIDDPGNEFHGYNLRFLHLACNAGTCPLPAAETWTTAGSQIGRVGRTGSCVSSNPDFNTRCYHLHYDIRTPGNSAITPGTIDHLLLDVENPILCGR